MSVEDDIQALLDGDRNARDLARFLLQHARFDPYLLAPVLAHPHVSRQVKAIEVLRYSRTRGAVELLVGALATTDALVARKAAFALGKVGPIAPELIVEALESAATSHHRLNILDALSRLRHPRALEVLLVQVDAWEPRDRARALDQLRRYGREVPVATVRAALADPDVKWAAATLAGKLRDPSFLEPLLDIYVASDAWGTVDLARDIANFGAIALEPILARAADPACRPKTWMHLQLASVLGRLLWSLDEARYWALWDRNIPIARDAALQNLASRARWFDRARCLAALAEHAHDANPTRRIWCIHAYDRMGEVERLHVLAADPDDDVRRRAEWALQSLANRPR